MVEIRSPPLERTTEMTSFRQTRLQHTTTTRYQRYRPDMYHPRMSIFWWIKRKPFVLFIVRELTSLFVAAYAVILLVKLNALRQGPQAWEALTETLSAPLSVALHIIILVFVLYHSITWFRLAPTAMVLRIGGRQIPGSVIIAANFIAWIVLSAGIYLLLTSI
jgi:fumarate reductase subunit C